MWDTARREERQLEGGASGIVEEEEGSWRKNGTAIVKNFPTARRAVGEGDWALQETNIAK